MSKRNHIYNLYLGDLRLNGESAYVTARVLDAVVSSLWRAHGDDMADFQGRCFPDDCSPHAYIYRSENEDDEAPPYRRGPDDDVSY